MSDSDDGNVSVTVSKMGTNDAMSKARETTQLDERHIATGKGWGIRPPYPPETLAAFSELNETHAAAIRKKARWEAGYGFDIVPHTSVDPEKASDDQRDTVDDFWYGSGSRWQTGPEHTPATTPTEVLELARMDYHMIGWCALEILVAPDGTPTGLAHVPATTVRVRKTEKETDDGETIVTSGHGYVQRRHGQRRYYAEAGDRYLNEDDPSDRRVFVDKVTGDVTYDSAEGLKNSPANELIFIPNPSPIATYYGIPDWISSMETLAMDQAAKQYNKDKLEHFGISHFAVIVKGGTLTEDSKDELRQMLEDLEDNPHRASVLEVEKLQEEASGMGLEGEGGSEIEVELRPLAGDNAGQMDYETLRKEAEQDIAKVHGVPPVLYNRPGQSNRSNSEEQVREFAEETIAPEQQKFEARLYEIIHKKALDVTDWTIEFELKGADRPDRDATIAQKRIGASNGTLTVDEARAELGKDPLPEDHPIDGETLLANLGDQAAAVPDDRPEDAPPVKNMVGTRESIDVDREAVKDDENDQVRMQEFDSSNIHSALYQSLTEDLYVRFHGGEDSQDRIYVYLGVDESEWDSWTSASSAGSYHYDSIRMSYPYEELTNTTGWPQIGA
ncbi:phage portal protein [Natronorubrum sp. FCH18a]|uniref:phage portal protein n=1 Tax=Natronorubrum sp. FCH18a TaxID=3447018 RepID=UPI003F50F04F